MHDKLKEVSTHTKPFLAQIERIMPRRKLEDLVRPCYHEEKHGNKPYDFELIPRIYLLQNWVAAGIRFLYCTIDCAVVP